MNISTHHFLLSLFDGIYLEHRMTLLSSSFLFRHRLLIYRPLFAQAEVELISPFLFVFYNLNKGFNGLLLDS